VFQDLIVDLIFGADILLSFHTAVKGDDDKLIFDKSVIARDYLKGWFLVDFFSTVPMDQLIEMAMSGGGSPDQLKVIFRNLFNNPSIHANITIQSPASAPQLIKLLRLIRLLKLTRILKLGKFLKNVDMDSINPAAFGLFSLLTKIVFTGHILSCFWFFMR